MKTTYWQKWNKAYREEFLTNIMPFWMKYGLDRKHGGVYTCLDRDGSLMDTTKSVWFQGRFGWVAAYAYNHVKKDAKWLAASKSCCEFLERHCFDKDGRAYFEVTAEGVGLRRRRYLFSECFAAIAYAEYSLASGDRTWAKKALELFKRIRSWATAGAALAQLDRIEREVMADGKVSIKEARMLSGIFAPLAKLNGGPFREMAKTLDNACADGKITRRESKEIAVLLRDVIERFTPAKYEPSLKTQGHSLTMILINVANVLKQVSDDPILDEQITESIALLRKYFIHPEFKALLETVGPKGEFIDTLAGRTINPGHCIETAWFLMDVAVDRGDRELLKTALTILDWSWNWGWDKKYGGIISFKDCRNLPPQCYEQDMKFWWPQCETIIASAYAYKLTGKAKYRKMHELVNAWAWKHLKDGKYPEWYGYLHYDGTVAQPAKGNIFKGPFHIPRMLMKMMELTKGL